MDNKISLSAHGYATVEDDLDLIIPSPGNATTSAVTNLKMFANATDTGTTSVPLNGLNDTNLVVDIKSVVTKVTKMIPTTLSSLETNPTTIPNNESHAMGNSSMTSKVLNQSMGQEISRNAALIQDKMQALEERYIDPLAVAKDITIKSVICVATVLGILLVVLIISKKELRQSRICWFILSGMFGVFIKVLAAYSMELTITEDSGWLLGENACYSYVFLSFLASACIAMTVLLLSLDRFIFAYCEETYRNKINFVVSVVLVIATWILSFGLASLITFYLGHPSLEYDPVIEFSSCELSKKSVSYHWPLVDFLTFAAVPAGLNLLILILIFGSCCKRRQLFYEDRSPMVNAIVLLIILNVLYIALVCPIHSAKYISKFFTKKSSAHHYSQARMRQVMFQGCEIAEALFYALFPAALFVLVPEIRIALAKCCRRVCCSRRPGERTHLMNK